MNVHRNARTTARSRAEMVRRMRAGQSPKAVATAFGVDVKVAKKWMARFEAEGPAGLEDRSSRPHRLRNPTPPQTVERIVALRRQRFAGQQIAKETGVSPATVSRVLRAVRLSRARDLDPLPPVVRYERKAPGEMIHLDIKKLGRFVRPGHRVTGRAAPGATAQDGHGWDFVHVAVDDYSRVAYVEVLDNEQRATAIGFLERTVAWFADRGITVTEILSDNGACYRSGDFAAACRTLQLTHRHTRPYRPRTNGKAERFIQTLLREWAYGIVYRTSTQRTLALTPWLGYYNQRRPHGALGHQPPESRLTAA